MSDTPDSRLARVMAILLLSAARNEERWAAKEETTDAKP